MKLHQSRLAWVLLSLLIFGASASAQNIVLDRQVRAGDLVVFPSVRDDKVFYYAPTQPRLATKGGKPQFSFLRYVENVGGEGGEDAAREGQGGGIVHALVTLGVEESQLERARQDLDRQIPGARIEGPVAYKSGTFGLVSSFANEQGEFTESVVGLGKAPLLDGSKAAVSIQLTKLGAKVLWESFQTPQPDITFQFEMELEGYRSPKQALIEADFDRIYKHESFDLALAKTGRVMVGVEISKALEDLYESKAIKLTQIGDDEQLDKLVQVAYGKIVEMMFQPPNQGLAGLRGPQRKSLLERATDSLNAERRRVRADNERKRRRNEKQRAAKNAALGKQAQADSASQEVEDLQIEAERLEELAKRAEDRLRALQEAPAEPEEESPEGEGDPKKSEPEDEKKTGAGDPKETAEAGAKVSPGGSPSPQVSPVKEVPAPGPKQTAGSDPKKPKPMAKPNAPGVEPNSNKANDPVTSRSPEDTKEKKADPEAEAPKAKPASKAREAEIAKATEDARRARAAADQAWAKVNAARDARREAQAGADAVAGDRESKPEATAKEPSMSFMMSRKLKQTRHRGVFRIDLNKYTQDTQSFPFAENIGDLRRYFDDQDFFRQVNLDDPFFRQREIAVFVDGLNASDFGDYINFVSVLLRKKHDGGQETLEEVRIDRKNFNEEGNNFRMLYGWKDDANRQSWMNYEYKPTWSFFGGKEVEGEWTSTSAGAISLAPPYQPRSVTLDADPDVLKDAKVRAVTVKLFYDLAGAELSKETTLNAMRGEFSRNMEFMLPQDVERYDYEIVWRLRGNKLVESGRQESVGSILFVDELPEI